MRVFVTGGTGLVGRHVIEQLRARGDTVTALSRSDAASAALTALGAEPVRGDLADLAAGGAAAAIAAADAVVHSAAVVLSRRGWDHYHAHNVVPVEALARLAAASAKRFVHVSSVAVYGRRTTYDGGAGSVTEEFGTGRPIFEGDHYARSKREAEAVLWRVASETGLRAVAIRPCVIYGVGDRQFTNRVARLVRSGFAPLFGSGHNPLSVVWAGNVAAALVAALDTPGATGPYNVTNDGGITQREFLEAFARGLGVRLRLIPIPRQLAWRGAQAVDGIKRLLRPSAPMTLMKTAVQFLANPNPYVSARAERELGWRPILAPSEAVELTGRALRAG